MYQHLSQFKKKMFNPLNTLEKTEVNDLVLAGRKDRSKKPADDVNEPSFGVDVLDDIDESVDTAEPPMYKVLLLNDDYTPMDFVVYVLKTFFKHDDTSAEKIMLNVHKKGVGVAGVYTFEVAETKSLQVNQFAQSNKYPLKSIIEEDN